VPTSSPNYARLSTSSAFYALASSIDPRIPSDAAAKMLADFRAAVRAEVAADFEVYGKQHDTLSWGQAYYIARDGLNGGQR